MHGISPTAEIVSGIIGLLLIGAIVLALTKQLKLPFTVVLVLAGVGLSLIADVFPDTLDFLHDLEISPDLILYVFLPTLLFESAFNLDARQLRKNLGAVLTLAVPGLLLSTLLIGAIVSLVTSIPLPAALLLGAILSATDPVSVIALFKQLGAPQRLTVLVEGESLLNDATAIVVAKILVGVVIAGTVSTGTVIEGALDFFRLFLGGVVVGCGLGLVTGYILGKVESDPFIEITLTTILAYFSFLLAEDILHVSGIMATMGAGLTLGGWGRMKISPSVRDFLEHFWEYVAFIANTLIFLMVGLRVELASLWGTMDLLVWVILAMLISRGVVVYGLMPLLGSFRNIEPVNLRYRTIMFWGGLRGAIALAIVLSLPLFEQAETFVALVMGAVLFTLLVQGVSIKALMKRLGLADAPLIDRLAKIEVRLAAKRRALRRIGQLKMGGLFSGPISARLRTDCLSEIERFQSEIEELRKTELDEEHERRFLFLRSFAEEKSLFTEMHNKGHLSEQSFRELIHILTLQIEDMRYGRSVRHMTLGELRLRRLELGFFTFLDRMPGLNALSEYFRLHRVAMNYEESWGLFQACTRVIERINELAGLESIPPKIVQNVRGQFEEWQSKARLQLDQVAEQYPEFVGDMQRRLGRRLVLLADEETAEEHAEQGTIQKGVEEAIIEDSNRELRALRGHEVKRLRIEPIELLRKVPLFAEIPAEEFAAIANHLLAHTVAANEKIIQQGEEGDSMFLIARGVVRVSREDGGLLRDLDTLMAGDFFGEMALLHPEPRNATVRAVTPNSLYELRREDLLSTIDKYPAIRKTLEKTDRERKAEISKESVGS